MSNCSSYRVTPPLPEARRAWKAASVKDALALKDGKSPVT
eukprot:CAMPEP_0172947010 /NCGR_PEP_ID=MMETSP1075-20121228/227355_1 /TAXON_ID=2916 /ORGANISM="Ceratium fusus, Strain PA161109" /LENGTH=39 /DNA_ID= /DNA_START= /DNA_END= /DNA_ORIENTATION=